MVAVDVGLESDEPDEESVALDAAAPLPALPGPFAEAVIAEGVVCSGFQGEVWG